MLTAENKFTAAVGRQLPVGTVVTLSEATPSGTDRRCAGALSRGRAPA